MGRIPDHTIDDAPEAVRPMLEAVARASLGTGELLNLHAEMAHAPVVLAVYTAMRRATEEHGTFDRATRAAIMLTTAPADRGAYAQSITSMRAGRAGWTDAQVRSLAAGTISGDKKLDALLTVVREATTNTGRVDDTTWKLALEGDWSSEQLTEAFAMSVSSCSSTTSSTTPRPKTTYPPALPRDPSDMLPISHLVQRSEQ